MSNAYDQDSLPLTEGKRNLLLVQSLDAEGNLNLISLRHIVHKGVNREEINYYRMIDPQSGEVLDEVIRPAVLRRVAERKTPSLPDRLSDYSGYLAYSIKDEELLFLSTDHEGKNEIKFNIPLQNHETFGLAAAHVNEIGEIIIGASYFHEEIPHFSLLKFNQDGQILSGN